MNDRDDTATVEHVAQLLAAANSALFITGAGVSADSGLPTYRGIGGLYSDGDTEDGYPIEVALSGHMLQSRPDICWKHIARIEAACRGARFNSAHAIIAELEHRLDRVWVLTQNVDGFHRAAGSENVIEIHGNIHELVCTSCSARHTVADYAGLDIPPKCAACGGLVRPDVVLFGEMLSFERVAMMRRELATGFDLVFSVGTTSVFPYIAGPVLSAPEGITTIEINPGDTEVSEAVDIRLRAGAAETFEAIRAVFTRGAPAA